MLNVYEKHVVLERLGWLGKGREGGTYNIVLDPIDSRILKSNLSTILTFLARVGDFMMADLADFQYTDFLECPRSKLRSEIAVHGLDGSAIAALDGRIEPFVFEHFEGAEDGEAGGVSCLHG